MSPTCKTWQIWFQRAQVFVLEWPEFGSYATSVDRWSNLKSTGQLRWLFYRKAFFDTSNDLVQKNISITNNLQEVYDKRPSTSYHGMIYKMSIDSLMSILRLWKLGRVHRRWIPKKVKNQVSSDSTTISSDESKRFQNLRIPRYVV